MQLEGTLFFQIQDLPSKICSNNILINNTGLSRVSLRKLSPTVWQEVPLTKTVKNWVLKSRDSLKFLKSTHDSSSGDSWKKLDIPKLWAKNVSKVKIVDQEVLINDP